MISDLIYDMSYDMIYDIATALNRMTMLMLVLMTLTSNLHVEKTNRSRVCYLSQEREIARVRSSSVVEGARRGQIDLQAIFDRAFGPFVCQRAFTKSYRIAGLSWKS